VVAALQALRGVSFITAVALVAELGDLMRGVNYFRRLATTISAGEGQQGVSPTTWRHSVVVVGRLVAVEDVSAGAPAGA
jgi:hypothetical protein